MSESGGRAEQAWSTWWHEENSFHKHLDWSWRLWLVAKQCVVYLLVAYGLAGSKLISDKAERYKFMLFLLLGVVFLLSNWVLNKVENQVSYVFRRLATMIVNFVVFVTVIYLALHHFVYFKYTVAMYYLLASAVYVVLLCGFHSVAMKAYKIHDYLVGHFLFVVLLLLSLIQVSCVVIIADIPSLLLLTRVCCVQVGYLQTWLLYHNALSHDVAIDDILKFARYAMQLLSLCQLLI